MSFFALPFPAIDPVLIELGPFAVRWYALAYLGGFFGGWYYFLRLLTVQFPHKNRAPVALTAKQIDPFFLWCVVGCIVGGRLGYVLFYNLEYYWYHWQDIVAVWQGGMSFHGGLLAMAIAAWLYARRIKVPLFFLSDRLAAATPIGLFLGRLANFINGELWGRPTTVSWGMVFPNAGDDIPRHPSQLYEALGEGLFLFILLWFLCCKTKALAKPGLVSSVFLLGYGGVRFSVEFFREPDAHLGLVFLGMSMGMVLSLCMVGAGVVILRQAVFNKNA